MSELSPRYLLWKCRSCGASYISDRWNRHTINWCVCKKSAVDAGQSYDRYLGQAHFVAESEDHQDLKEGL